MNSVAQRQAMLIRGTKILASKLHRFCFDNIHTNDVKVAMQYGAASKTLEIVNKFNFNHFFGEEVTVKELGYLYGAVLSCAALGIGFCNDFIEELKAVANAAA